MIKGNFDIKLIVILILASMLILTFIFSPSKSSDDYKDKIQQLEEQNKLLLFDNDKLKLINTKLDEKVDNLLYEINETQIKLHETNNKIKDLENGKSKVSDYVNNLNADGIAESLSDYLNTTKK